MPLTTLCFTGDLIFAHVNGDDRIDRIASYLKCKVTAGRLGEIVSNHIDKLTVQVESATILEYSYLTPRVKDSSISDAQAAEIQECVAGQICEVVCMFGGRSVPLKDNVVCDL